MMLGSLATEILVQIISPSVSSWSASDGCQGLEIEGFSDPHRFHGVNRQWSSVIEHLMIREIVTWSPMKFIARFKDASFDGDLLAIRLAYSTSHEPLISGRQEVYYLEGVEPFPRREREGEPTNPEGPCQCSPAPRHRPLGVEALCIAASKDHRAAVEFFLQKGVDIQGTYDTPPDYILDLWDFGSPDHLWACGACAEAEIFREPKSTWVTPLYASAQWGGRETIRTLLEKGAQVNSTWSYLGRTALFGAIFALPHAGEDVSTNVRNILAKTHLLLDHGADPMVRSDDQESVLHGASERGLTQVISLLLDVEPRLHGLLHDGASPLVKACRGSHSEAVKMLLKKGSYDVNEHSSESKTRLKGLGPLSWAIIGDPTSRYAATETPVATVQTLLDHGADVNGGRQGVTPIVLAVESNEVKVVEILLQAGADVNRSDAQGSMPLESCIASVFENGCDLRIPALLLEHGADPNESTSNSRTPLIETLMRPTHLSSKSKLLEILLQHGADVDKVGKEGYPLSIITNGRRSVFEKLSTLKLLQPYSNAQTRESFAKTIRLLARQVASEGEMDRFQS